MPPTIPEIIPDIIGAPEANATPRHKGSATKKTTIPAGISLFKLLNIGYKIFYNMQLIYSFKTIHLIKFLFLLMLMIVNNI